jgi:uncharacterized protein
VTRGRRPAPSPLAPGAALYDCRITHTRLAPLRNAFTYRTYLWLVDLDQLPRPGPGLRLLAGFRARDHLGDPRQPIRANLDRYLRSQGIDLAGGKVMMLAHARVLGHLFNPLTIYWCHRPDVTLACVVAEVHNTGRPATARALLGAAARHPWSTVAVSALIRWQGIRLYLRGLPVVARPPRKPQENAQ